MPTISNTSPLLNLAIIDKLELIRGQFERALVPPSVVEEFCLGEGRPGSSALRRALEEDWIVTEAPSDEAFIRTLRQDLDQGESQAIALAAEKETNLILLDVREGRRRARKIGLEVTGVLGILARSDRQGELDSLAGALDRLDDEAGEEEGAWPDEAFGGLSGEYFPKRNRLFEASSRSRRLQL